MRLTNFLTELKEFLEKGNEKPFCQTEVKAVNRADKLLPEQKQVKHYQHKKPASKLYKWWAKWWIKHKNRKYTLANVDKQIKIAHYNFTKIMDTIEKLFYETFEIDAKKDVIGLAVGSAGEVNHLTWRTFKQDHKKPGFDPTKYRFFYDYRLAVNNLYNADLYSAFPGIIVSDKKMVLTIGSPDRATGYSLFSVMFDRIYFWNTTKIYLFLDRLKNALEKPEGNNLSMETKEPANLEQQLQVEEVQNLKKVKSKSNWKTKEVRRKEVLNLMKKLTIYTHLGFTYEFADVKDLIVNNKTISFSYVGKRSKTETEANFAQVAGYTICQEAK